MATAAGAGLSTEGDAIRAARQAARAALERAGIERADFGLVFATGAHRPHYAGLLGAIRATLGTDCLAGCSAWGVLAAGEEIEGRPAVAVLAVRSDRIDGASLLAPVGDDHGPGAASEIGRQVADRSGSGLLVLLPDPFAVRSDPFLRALDDVAPGVLTVGGASSGDPGSDGTSQFCGGNVATRALAALHLAGDLTAGIGVTQGCQPLGQPCRVTASGGSNVILELDGRPALEVLRSRLPAALRDAVERLAGHLFVALPPDPHQAQIAPGEYLVRSLLGADPERGALAVGATIMEGQLILLALREGQAARDDLKQMLARVAAASPPSGYRFGLYFNCAARGSSLHGMPGIDSAYLAGAFGDLPIVGFFGNAEIAPLRGSSRLFTHTGVLALVA